MDRKPLRYFQDSEDAIWPYHLIANARKRVAAKRYLAKYGEYPEHTVTNASTKLLVMLCKDTRDRLKRKAS